jgi:hypothetical protein
MENRGALRFVVGALPRQLYQWRQSACSRDSSCAQPRGTALRLGASTLLKSQTYLGAQYRRLRSKLGAPKAITAMAHRLARLVYRMLKYGQQYVDKGAQYYERRNRQQQIEFVRKKAAQLGLQVTPAHP